MLYFWHLEEHLSLVILSFYGNFLLNWFISVNDLGGDRDGTGKSSAADLVVNEIRQRGGQAVADYSKFQRKSNVFNQSI